MRNPGNKWVIGVDFDNTTVSYDYLLHSVATEQGLISTAQNPGKREIRDEIRRLPEGETSWQQLQAVVYGPRIDGAMLIEGVRVFFARCSAEDCQVYIISHKTEFANFGNPKPNLREAALGWMERQGFFAEPGLGLSRADVFFGATRQEKIDHICRLRCTHFIDDLEEVFLEPNFPVEVEKILYTPQPGQTHVDELPGVIKLATWQDITEHLFGKVIHDS